MKTKYPGLLLLFIAFILSTASIARAQTPPPPAPPAETATQSILDILSHSNLVAATYATADLSDKSFGAGIALGYRIENIVTPDISMVPVLRLDYIRGEIWMPSGSLQLQYKIKVSDKISITPFAFAGIATTWNSGADGAIVTISGLGAAVQLGKNWGIGADYEFWNGGPFHAANQVRIGPFLVF